MTEIFYKEDSCEIMGACFEVYKEMGLSMSAVADSNSRFVLLTTKVTKYTKMCACI